MNFHFIWKLRIFESGLAIVSREEKANFFIEKCVDNYIVVWYSVSINDISLNVMEGGENDAKTRLL